MKNNSMLLGSIVRRLSTAVMDFCLDGSVFAEEYKKIMS